MPFTTAVNISVPLFEGDLYETIKPLNYQSPTRRYENGKLKNFVVPAGYKTDLASVPRLPLVFWWVGRRGDAGAIIHDFLCDHGVRLKQVKDRAEADEIYLEILLECKVPYWCAYPMYLGVRGRANEIW